MGKRGPLPQPTLLKLARGETRPSRHNVREPATRHLAEPPRPPAWLDPIGRDTWRELAALLTSSRVLGEQDLLLLALLADQTSVYRRAAAFLATKGESFVLLDGDGNPKGVQAYPQVAIRQRAAEELRRLCEHFGLSPSARTRVQADPASGPTELEVFLGGKRGA